MRFVCKSCARPMGDFFRSMCECGGMIEVEYDLDQVGLIESPNPYVRFGGLLPIATHRHLLPQDAEYAPTIHATSLGKRLGLPSLYLKNETVLPTGTTKDRMAAVSLTFLWEQGVRTFCTSSTGNSSTSYARAIRTLPEMTLYLFTAENFVSRVQHADHPQVVHFGMRDASFVEASEYAGVYARQHGHVYERGFFNLGRREGLKLAFCEACDQIPAPIDWYVQAVSSAMGVYGTHKAARELHAIGQIDRSPKLLCAQQERCSPMVRAFQEGHDSIQRHHIVSRPEGIAEAILRGDPSKVYPYIREIVLDSGGNFVAVTDDEIRTARRWVEDLEGVPLCFSAATAVAGLIKQVSHGNFPRHDTILINITGSDRPRTQSATGLRWLHREQGEWTEEVARKFA